MVNELEKSHGLHTLSCLRNPDGGSRAETRQFIVTEVGQLETLSKRTVLP